MVYYPSHTRELGVGGVVPLCTISVISKHSDSVSVYLLILPVCLSVLFRLLYVYPFVCQSFPVHTLPVFFSLLGLTLSTFPLQLSLPASTLSLILSSFPFLPPHYLLSCPALSVCPPFYLFSCPAFPSCLHIISYPVQNSLSSPTLPLILSSSPCLSPL